MLLAAEETLKSGFDKFLIVDGQSQFKRNIIANNPGYISAMPGQLTAVGPSQTAMPRYESAILIKMFKSDDPGRRERGRCTKHHCQPEEVGPRPPGRPLCFRLIATGRCSRGQD